MLSLVVVLLCLLLNAGLACIEMAFVTIDKKILRKKNLDGDKRALIITQMHESPERILSVIQIGITLVGAISAAVGGAGAQVELAPWIMETFSFTLNVSEFMAITCVVVPITILSVVIGELVPKSVAIRYAMPITLASARGLRVAERALGFLVNPLERVTNLIVDLILPARKEIEPVTTEEISLSGLRTDHKQYVHNLIELDAKTAQMVMVPWTEVKWIYSQSEGRAVLDLISNTRHTRIPVVDGDQVLGFLHAKEFINLFRSGEGDNWASFIRPPVFIDPKTKLVNSLRIMQKQKIHLLFVGENRSPQGILTLEDVFEEVVGDIIDEDEDGRVLRFLRRTRFRSPS